MKSSVYEGVFKKLNVKSVMSSYEFWIILLGLIFLAYQVGVLVSLSFLLSLMVMVSFSFLILDIYLCLVKSYLPYRKLGIHIVLFTLFNMFSFSMIGSSEAYILVVCLGSLLGCSFSFFFRK